MMTRILFAWAIRHPASAYVQGINDLCAPLLLVFLSEYIMKADSAEAHLLKASKNMIKVNRMIKHSTEPQTQQQSEESIFESEHIDRLLKSKVRTCIYDIKESDFQIRLGLSKEAT